MIEYRGLQCKGGVAVSNLAVNGNLHSRVALLATVSACADHDVFVTAHDHRNLSGGRGCQHRDINGARSWLVS